MSTFSGTFSKTAVQLSYGFTGSAASTILYNKDIYTFFKNRNKLTKTFDTLSSRGVRAGIVQCFYHMSTGRQLTNFKKVYNFNVEKVLNEI